MTEANEEAAGRSDNRSKIAALVVLICGVVAGVLSVVNTVRRMEDGWPGSDPWGAAASLLLPLGIVSLAVGLLSTGVRKRVFAVIAIALATVGTVCVAMAL